ncbi:hypothetical protein [Lysinibacillus sp. NPDC056232]
MLRNKQSQLCTESEAAGAKGSVVIPEVLRPYMGGKEVIAPK